MFVKICGITNEDDALLAIALGADALGFVIAPSTRQIAVQKIFDITRRLPPEILTVGVFRDELPRRVIEKTQEAGLKAAQLHGHETPEDVRAVTQHIRTVIKAFPAGSTDAANAHLFGTRMVLIDAPAPGSGDVFDWKLVGEMPGGLDIILAGGLTPENVASGITQVSPWGVDVSSGVEISPGLKDPVRMKRFIDAARAASPTRSSDSPLPYDWMDE